MKRKASNAEHTEIAPEDKSQNASRGESKGYVLIALIYLLGLVMGALDMSIVNPARTVIQNQMGVDDTIGVWVITIYTLAYAASIPVMGKLADRHGRKYIYLLCIFLFGAGSALCGVAQSFDSFELLLAARVIQALGGGGIMPVATAEFGTAFPEEKRGMALGLVGMVYGMGSIFGPMIGSFILDVFGQDQWQFIFYVNIPICLVVLLLGVKALPNTTANEVKPIDGLGILILTVMTLSLMYGLKNIDFFDIGISITSTDVWAFLVAFLVLLPFFILRETRASDPIINLSYFRDINVIITLTCAILSGVLMMGTLFFPQFCENAMLMKSGSGGYFVALLGLGSGVGAMMSGKMIDKRGVKPVLALGFVGSAIGSLFMAFIACDNPNLITVCATLVLSGLGLGFTMGTPLNYMMLENTDIRESNSALATLSLVRSIGTAVAPAIMVAFIVHASVGMQDNLMAAMPKEVNVTPLPHAQELDQKLDDMRANEDTAEMLEGLDIPNLSDYSTIEINMDGDSEDFDATLSDDMISKMENSDVTTIVGMCKEMSAEMFEQNKAQLTEKAISGISAGITSMEDGAQEMKDGLNEMSSGITQMDSGLKQLKSSISDMDAKINQADAKISDFDSQISKMKSGSNEIQKGIEQLSESLPGMEAQLANLTEGTSEWTELNSKIEEIEGKVSTMKAQKDELDRGIEGLDQARNGVSTGKKGMQQGKSEMQAARNEMANGRSELVSAHKDLQTAYADLNETISQMKEVRDAIPGMFDEAEANYLAAIDAEADTIQATYQQTLNAGFKDMAVFVAICAIIGALLLIPYREKAPKGTR